MGEHPVLESERFRICRLISAAALVLAVTACATAPSPRSDSDRAEPADPPTVTRDSDVPESPEPKAAPEKTPSQSAREPVQQPAVDAEVETRTEPTPSTDDVSAPDPAPAAEAPPPSKPSTSPSRAPATAVLRGRVNLDVSQVDDVDNDSVRDTIVYFKPAGAAVSVAPRDFEITTRRKRMLPDVLVVPVGSTVAFPNRDDILHNVFSVSSAANFDLGLYGEGESKSHTFAEPGLAVIHCNVHHAMRADVLVVDTPFYARAGLDGGFAIEGIGPTAGELVAWHPRAGFVRRQVTLPLAESLDVELTLTRPRIPDHLDKTGQPYRPERPGRR